MAGERKASVQLKVSTIRNGDGFDVWLLTQSYWFRASEVGNYYNNTTGVYHFGNHPAYTLDTSCQLIKMALESALTAAGLTTHYQVSYSFIRDNTGKITDGLITIAAINYGDQFNMNVSLFNSNGSDFSVNSNLGNIWPIEAYAETTYITCGGSSTGSIQVTTQRTVGAVTYQWSTGVTTFEVSYLGNLPAGIYSVVIIDANGTSTVVNNITIQENPPLVLSATLGANSIIITVTGGIAPYYYKWADGPTDKDRQNLATGAYAVTVTDANGCQRAGTFYLDTERFHFSKNPVLLKLQALDAPNKPNLTFLCEVWIEKNHLANDFELAAILEQPATSTGATTFDVAEVLDAYLKPYFPAYGKKTISRADGVFKRFQLKHREKYGNPPAPAAIETQDVRYVIGGGLDFEEYAAQTFFTSYRYYVKNFFSWYPVNKPVFKEQPEFIFFMPDSFALTEFKVRCRLYFEDGTSSVVDLHSQINVNRYELYCIPAGFSQNNLTARAGGKPVEKYNLWVTDTNNIAISEIRTYFVDFNYYRYKRFFIYANSIGGLDTLAATGYAQKQVKVDSEKVDRILLPGYDAALGDVEITRKFIRPSLKLSAGFIRTKEERLALQDLILSEEVRLYGTDRYLGGELVVKNEILDDEYETVQPFDFEFVLAGSNRYTPQLKLAGYAAPDPAQPIPFEPPVDEQ